MPLCLARADLTERSEKLAEQGDVDASMAAVQQAERLRGDADRLATRYSQPDRFMLVCEVCGLFIQSTDNEARRRDHIEGKQVGLHGAGAGLAVALAFRVVPHPVGMVLRGRACCAPSSRPQSPQPSDPPHPPPPRLLRFSTWAGWPSATSTRSWWRSTAAAGGLPRTAQMRRRARSARRRCPTAAAAAARATAATDGGAAAAAAETAGLCGWGGGVWPCRGLAIQVSLQRCCCILSAFPSHQFICW
jgi:hypothetical protein